MIDKKKVINTIYAIALFFCIISCVMFLFLAINYTQIQFYDFGIGTNPEYGNRDLYAPQLLIMCWVGFAVMFITLVIMFLMLFFNKKIMKKILIVAISLTILVLLSLLIASFINIVYYYNFDIDYPKLDITFYTFMFDLRSQLVLAFVAFCIVGAILLWNERNKKKEEIVLTEEK